MELVHSVVDDFGIDGRREKACEEPGNVDLRECVWEVLQDVCAEGGEIHAFDVDFAVVVLAKD